MVHVVIARLPYGPLARVDFADACSSRRTVVVDVRALPMFAVGDVITDQRVEKDPSAPSGRASICDGPESGQTVRFEFDASTLGLSQHDRRTAPVRDFSIGLPSGSFVSLERLATSRNSSVMLIGSVDGRWFLLPAAETLRSFMAPTSELMAGLFGQSLPSFLRATVRDLSISGGPSSTVAFGLNGGFGRSVAPYIANLILDYNPSGARAGGLIHASRHQADPALVPGSQGCASHGVAAGSGPLPVCFPFSAGKMSIRAKCLVLDDDLFLICRILGGDWPSMPEFILNEEVIERDNSMSPTFRRVAIKPGRRKSDAQPRGNGDEAGANSVPLAQDVALRGPASSFGEVQHIFVEPLGWSNKPRISTKRIGVLRPPVTTVPTQDRDLDDLALGEADPTGDRSPADVRPPDLASPERFQQAIRLLDRLIAAGRILRHEDIAEAEVVHRGRDWLKLESRDELDVWTFPVTDVPGWTMLRAKDGEPRRPRSLLIRRVLSNDLETFYWFSIEGRGEDRYAVLLVRFAEDTSDADPAKHEVISPLLGVIGQLTSVRGRIADAASFFSNLGFGDGRAVVLDHRWVRPSPAAAEEGSSGARQDGDPAATPPAEFDDEAVMQAVDALLSPLDS